MQVAFRTDASIQMGTGHVMRCLTLAEALSAKGAQCTFICREHAGNLIEHIRSKGHAVHKLRTGSDADTDLAHSAWLGATQAQDAHACAALLAALQPDWLVVDHYALDARWEGALRPHCGKLMVIDDLADRPHQCDVLLDQTFGRNATDYGPWVSPQTSVLCGSQYALLRPEFAALRPCSLERREQPRLEHLLISMGGVDKDNATGQVLQALKASALPAGCRVTVVMGSTAPWLAEVRQTAAQLPWATAVRVGLSVGDMAQLMADCDLAIGAAGTTTWERCCLGLPTAMIVLADNQRQAAAILAEAEAVFVLPLGSPLAHELATLIERVSLNPEVLRATTYKSMRITDGIGCRLVLDALEIASAY